MPPSQNCHSWPELHVLNTFTTWHHIWGVQPCSTCNWANETPLVLLTGNLKSHQLGSGITSCNLLQRRTQLGALADEPSQEPPHRHFLGAHGCNLAISKHKNGYIDIIDQMWSVWRNDPQNDGFKSVSWELKCCHDLKSCEVAHGHIHLDGRDRGVLPETMDWTWSNLDGTRIPHLQRSLQLLLGDTGVGPHLKHEVWHEMYLAFLMGIISLCNKRHVDSRGKQILR